MEDEIGTRNQIHKLWFIQTKNDMKTDSHKSNQNVYD